MARILQLADAEHVDLSPLGDVIEDKGDMFGDGVNVASRLESMAEPGSIFVSSAVVRSADRSRRELFQRIGHRSAKNMPERLEVYAVRIKAGRAVRRLDLDDFAMAISFDAPNLGPRKSRF